MEMYRDGAATLNRAAVEISGCGAPHLIRQRDPDRVAPQPQTSGEIRAF